MQIFEKKSMGDESSFWLLVSGEATSPVLSRPSDLTLSPNLLRPLPARTDREDRETLTLLTFLIPILVCSEWRVRSACGYIFRAWGFQTPIALLLIILILVHLVSRWCIHWSCAYGVRIGHVLTKLDCFMHSLVLRLRRANWSRIDKVGLFDAFTGVALTACKLVSYWRSWTVLCIHWCCAYGVQIGRVLTKLDCFLRCIFIFWGFIQSSKVSWSWRGAYSSQ
jgi:hypothetical protein